METGIEDADGEQLESDGCVVLDREPIAGQALERLVAHPAEPCHFRAHGALALVQLSAAGCLETVVEREGGALGQPADGLELASTAGAVARDGEPGHRLGAGDGPGAGRIEDLLVGQQAACVRSGSRGLGSHERGGSDQGREREQARQGGTRPERRAAHAHSSAGAGSMGRAESSGYHGMPGSLSFSMRMTSPSMVTSSRKRTRTVRKPRSTSPEVLVRTGDPSALAVNSMGNVAKSTWK